MADTTITLTDAFEMSISMADGSADNITIPTDAAIYYYFTLTGENDSLDDVVIPISSFQARKRSGSPSYLSVVVPGDDYTSDINSRTNGELVIDMAYYWGGEVVLQEEILRSDFESLSIAEGIRAKTYTLSGYRTETFSQSEVELITVNSLNQYSGKYTAVLATPMLYINPGDLITYGSVSFTAETVGYSVSERSDYMSVTGE